VTEETSADSVRKKQKLRTILTQIGDSLQDFFKEKILENTGESPNLISIEDVQSVEKGTSKSKVHFVTYYLNTDTGKQSENLVVKFSADESRYEKEIKNHKLISAVPERFPGIYMPKIIYKSSQNRCIIYEGVAGKSFRDTQMEKNHKYQLAGQTLAAIHDVKKGNFSSEPYKKLILYLLSTLGDYNTEQEILELTLPFFLALEESLGTTMIHGDFHQGNLLFSSEITAPIQEILSEFPPKIKVYILDPEFVMPGRDRSEDIGTFFAKPCIKEFRKYGTVDETQKDIMAFIEGYNFALENMESNYSLFDLYPSGLTIDFHVASYLLYDISEKILENKLSIQSEELEQNLKLLFLLLKDKPFSFEI
jgi:hypothetical protein